MAKKRKSIFDDEIISDVKSIAKDIQSKTIEIVPDSSNTSPVSNKLEKKKDRYKVIYIDKDYHQKALVKSAQLGLKMGRYIESLIDNDNGL